MSQDASRYFSARLVTGAPVLSESENRPSGSFTRFLVPFGHALVCADAAKRNSRWRFRPAMGSREGEGTRVDGDRLLLDLRDRRAYFSPESSAALFGRARWFVLEDRQGGEPAPGTPFFQETIHLPVPGTNQRKPLTLACSAPALVLMEYSEPRQDCTTEQDDLRVGFLVLETWFPRTDEDVTLADQLEVNEHFRFLDHRFTGHYNQVGMQATMGRWFENFLKLLVGGLPEAEQERMLHNRWSALLGLPALGLDGRSEFNLIPVDQAVRANNWLSHRDRQDQHEDAVGGADADRGWMIYPDTRGFTHTAAFFREQQEQCRSWPTEAEGPWHDFLNVDRPGDTAVGENLPDYHRNWMDPLTYRRWEHFQTRYGYTPFSAVLLTLAPPPAYVTKHMGTVYFDLTLLFLYQRVVSLRLRQSLMRVTRRARLQEDASGKAADWLLEYTALRRQISQFAILYQFPTWSNQQQALEMGGIARQAMDLDVLAEDLHAMSESAHSLMESEVMARRDAGVAILKNVAIWVAVPGAVAQLSGKSFEPVVKWVADRTCLSENSFFALLCGIGVISAIVARRCARARTDRLLRRQTKQQKG